MPQVRKITLWFIGSFIGGSLLLAIVLCLLAIHRYWPHILSLSTKTKLIVVTNQNYYFVQGEVNTPNRFIHPGQLTLRTAITQAGGFAPFADRRQVRVQRANGQVHVFDMSDMESRALADIFINTNDDVVIPRRRF